MAKEIAGEDAEQQEFSFIAGNNKKWYKRCEMQFLTKLNIVLHSHAPKYLHSYFKTMSTKKLHVDIYSSFITNHQKTRNNQNVLQ